MGCSLSEEQESLLAVQFTRVIVMLDSDEAGQKGTDNILARLGRKLWVKTVALPDGRQPDQLSSGELAGLLEK